MWLWKLWGCLYRKAKFGRPHIDSSQRSVKKWVTKSRPSFSQILHISPILAQWSFNPNLIPLWGQNGSFHVLSKGQLISKCPFGVKTSSNKPTKLFLDICPEIFCSFLGGYWKLFGLLRDLVSNIMNKEAYRKPQKASRKPTGRYIKFQSRYPEIISLVFWKKFWHQKDILKLTDL